MQVLERAVNVFLIIAVLDLIYVVYIEERIQFQRFMACKEKRGKMRQEPIPDARGAYSSSVTVNTCTLTFLTRTWLWLTTSEQGGLSWEIERLLAKIYFGTVDPDESEVKDDNIDSNPTDEDLSNSENETDHERTGNENGNKSSDTIGAEVTKTLTKKTSNGLIKSDEFYRQLKAIIEQMDAEDARKDYQDRVKKLWAKRVRAIRSGKVISDLDLYWNELNDLDKEWDWLPIHYTKVKSYLTFDNVHVFPSDTSEESSEDDNYDAPVYNDNE